MWACEKARKFSEPKSDFWNSSPIGQAALWPAAAATVGMSVSLPVWSLSLSLSVGRWMCTTVAVVTAAVFDRPSKVGMFPGKQSQFENHYETSCFDKEGTITTAWTSHISEVKIQCRSRVLQLLTSLCCASRSMDRYVSDGRKSEWAIIDALPQRP